VPGQTASDLVGCIADYYELQAEIAERLRLKIKNPDPEKPDFPIPKESKRSIDDLLHERCKDRGRLAHVGLEVYYSKGEMTQKDMSCDSNYMLTVMDKVGEAIRRKFAWVPLLETVYLVMDNAGGHGTKDTVDTYTTRMKEKYNIEIIHQVPRSPETNLLDLGIWRSIQAAVEKEHAKKTCDVDSLGRSVQRAWDKRLNPTAFSRVADRLLKVLDLIVESDGDNHFVEGDRGTPLVSDPVAASAEGDEAFDAPEAPDFIADHEDEL
jgi:hypothetical protein